MKKEIRKVYSFKALPSIIKELDKLVEKRGVKRSSYIEGLIVADLDKKTKK